MFIIWIVIIIVIIWFVSDKMKPKNDDAMEVLKKRYAKGEISKEEYDRIKKELE